ncbi:MAG: nitroreductase family deazaflavin-dependent oxidoreductase [Gammaproteobacteria bacterium]
MTKFDVRTSVDEIEAGKVPDWIQAHLAQYLESGGREGHYFDAGQVGGSGLVPSLLLTTVGRRSGRRVTMPLFYGTTAQGYVVIASKGGAATQPAWYHNLCAAPEVEVQVGTERHTLRARIAEGEERSRLWQQMAQVYPPYEDYQARTERTIPVVVLERV